MIILTRSLKMKLSKRIIYYIPTFIILVVIFGFSAQNGQTSGRLSTVIYHWLAQYITMPFSETAGTYLIRKAAHMSEYALLYLSLYYGHHKNGLSHVPLLSLLMVVLFASLDEYHQTFVPGRAGMYTDVLIDTCGALVMMGILWLLGAKNN